MKSRLKFGLQWLVLFYISVSLLPMCLLTGLVLALFGSRPLLVERGTYDLDGTPVRYQVFSLRFPSGREPRWLTDFIRQYTLDWFPSLTSGLRGWLSPAAVGRLFLPMWNRFLDQCL